MDGGKQMIPAASVILIRDSDTGLQVFMAVRSRSVDFVPGAWVFPGGKVDASDKSEEMFGLCESVELQDEERALRISGLRELFEEAGVLIAKGPRETLSKVQLSQWRKEVEEDSSLEQILKESALKLTLDALTPFSHWITPEGLPKRYDTHFFLVQMPADQEAVHDGHELVNSAWFDLNELIQKAESKDIPMIFPTKMNLYKLALAKNCQEAFAFAEQEQIVTIIPKVVQSDEGWCLAIPENAGYPVTSDVFEMG